jgi:diaminohydroxyphosphoribosylaminopyrimidine deaminase/5-amino-6-(5-phosphoribosylamino)uracil reductase
VFTHQYFLQRCIQLAQNGLGFVAPNPLVGAVLAHGEKIIGEGWHQGFGKAHAEVNCIASVKETDKKLITESILYVSLEPCNHFGKTPPCSDLILQHGIKKVVIGSGDPNPIVAGKGIKKLRDAGVDVVENILQKECDELNKRFFAFHRKKRPYIILKIAQSADDFMAANEAKQVWMTNDLSKRLSHRWRAEEQAILVGTNTALIDNPSLTTRLWDGKNPMRILIDKTNRVPLGQNIFSADANTIVVNESQEKTKENIVWTKADFNKNLVEQILKILSEKNIQSLIVEGGPFTIQQFIDANLWDEARVITAPILLGSGKASPVFSGTLFDSFSLLHDKVELWQNV